MKLALLFLTVPASAHTGVDIGMHDNLMGLVPIIVLGWMYLRALLSAK